ncbi:MAG: DUF1292 domain-containing protein [Defluviitaleaceae bacterium]|nr:DUF1292 domain-containing protein [Defluviitaleaceae bacterium]
MPLLEEMPMVNDPCACGKKEASDCHCSSNSAGGGCGCGSSHGHDHQSASGCGCGSSHAMPSGGCGSGCSCSSSSSSMPNVKMITDDGKEVECLVLDSFEFEGKKYIAILPESQDGEKTEEIILLNYIVQGRTTSLTSIENEQEHAKVTDFFQSYFDFEELQLA